MTRITISVRRVSSTTTSIRVPECGNMEGFYTPVTTRYDRASIFRQPGPIPRTVGPDNEFLSRRKMERASFFCSPLHRVVAASFAYFPDTVNPIALISSGLRFWRLLPVAWAETAAAWILLFVVPRCNVAATRTRNNHRELSYTRGPC